MKNHGTKSLLLKIGYDRNNSAQLKGVNIVKDEVDFLKKVEFHHGQKTADECKRILAEPGGQELSPLTIVTRAVQRVFATEILAASKVSNLPTNSD